MDNLIFSEILSLYEFIEKRSARFASQKAIEAIQDACDALEGLAEAAGNVAEIIEDADFDEPSPYGSIGWK